MGIDGPAIIDRVEMTWDWEGKQPIAYNVTFSGNGAPTLGAAAAADATFPADQVLPSSGTKIELGTPAYAEVESLRTATLAVWRTNTDYVNSGTDGSVKRLKGNLDASLSFAVHTDDFSSLPVVSRGTNVEVKLYTTASLFWLIESMKLVNLSDLVCDRESAAMVGATLNFEFNGFALAVIGKIVTPGGTNIWP